MNYCSNRNYQKSAQTAYNDAVQPYTAAGAQVNILGTQVTDTGCSIRTNAGGFTFRNSGLYRISYDVTSTPTAIGEQVLQLYRDQTPMPCAVSTVTTIAGDVVTQHVETTIVVQTCCAVNPTVSARISGVAGTATHVCASAVKLA